MDTQKVPLGYIYALGENGSYIDSSQGEYYHTPARTNLNILRTYLHNLDTEVYGVILVSDAVRPPVVKTTTEKKWLFFGPEVKHTSLEYLDTVSNFHFVVVAKEPGPTSHTNGQRCGSEMVQSGVLINTRTPDCIAELFTDKERHSAIIMHEPKIQSWCEMQTAEAYWTINPDGLWCCKLKAI